MSKSFFFNFNENSAISAINSEISKLKRIGLILVIAFIILVNELIILVVIALILITMFSFSLELKKMVEK